MAIVDMAHCNTCRAVLQEGNRFCEDCGAAVLSAAASPGAASEPRHSQATRLLSAAAFSNSSVRGAILEWILERNRSTPPEIGIDLELVARVAAYAEHRDRNHELALAALATVAAIGLVFVPITFVAFVAAAVLVFLKRARERTQMLERFDRDHFAKADVERLFTKELTARQRSAVPPAATNLTVYSGFSPFVGMGLEMGGWSFAIAADKPKDDFRSTSPLAVSVAELNSAVTDRLAKLNLPDLDQRDHFFMHGADVTEHPFLLPNKYARPVSVLPPELQKRCSFGNDPHVRHYRWIRVSDWAGDVAVSCFLRCYMRGPTLFVEFKRHLLTPLRDTIRKIDDLAPLSFTGIVGEALLSVFIAPFAMLGATLAIIARVQKWWDEIWDISGRERRKAIDRTARWDYGATTTIRQTYASGEYTRYFQWADTDSYQKTLEREILGALVDFLDARGVDTSDLRERSSTILNNGVIVQNGDIKAGSMAVGERAKSVQRKLTRMVKAKTRGAA